MNVSLLADIAHGHTDLADILFLVAFIIFVIGAVIAAMAKSTVQVLAFAGFACLALAWLVL